MFLSLRCDVDILNDQCPFSFAARCRTQLVQHIARTRRHICHECGRVQHLQRFLRSAQIAVCDMAIETKNHGRLTLDRDGFLQYNGDLRLGEESEERALLGFMNCEAASVVKLKNKLHGAWTLTHQIKCLSATRLTKLIAADGNGPGKGRARRHPSGVQAPLRKPKASDRVA